MIYFLARAFKCTSPVDLYTFMILSIISNSYQIFRDTLFYLYPDYFITPIHAVDSTHQKEWQNLAIIDIFLCVIIMLTFYFLTKPVSHQLYLRALSKLGDKQALWKIYKFFTLLISLVIVDLVLNLFYFATTVYFTYFRADLSPFVWIDVLFFFMIVFTSFYANFCIFNKYQKGFKIFSIIRVFVEIIKILKALLILNSINANYIYSKEMQDDLGNIKFFILVQEIISLALFIPILSLGRFIFFGFTQKKLNVIFDKCIEIFSFSQIHELNELKRSLLTDQEKLQQQQAHFEQTIEFLQNLIIEKFPEQKIYEDMRISLKSNILILPQTYNQIENPVLREEEWCFAHNIFRILFNRLKVEIETTREKRRAIIGENYQTSNISYIQECDKFIEQLADDFENLIGELSEEAFPFEDIQKYERGVLEQSLDDKVNLHPNDYIKSLIMLVYKTNVGYLPNLLKVINLTQGMDSLLKLKIEIGEIQGEIKELIDKERSYLVEFAKLEFNLAYLKNQYLEFCRLEDKLYFDRKVEYSEVKNSQELQELLFNENQF
ncbi:UNKNOWN [Stylonychia lemnae]|uniref:Transmembrane protein n=1 Tax=Stylonychia lemnae TaxID=5949 RepID=A0A077ZXG0_STYLE|nr:UNKNOWN [Stylonychia lemnae]|eukprot:CDW74241.1 UNKNOWN [Stylonychia lemnae]